MKILNNDELETETYEYYRDHIGSLYLFRFTDAEGIPRLNTHDNELDAFRHAYVSGVYTMEYGSFIANTLGVANEIQGANPENERNMDNWNNSVGRDADQVGDDTIHGGSGNDLIIGFTGSNEAKQTLDAGESDDDTIYGWEKVA